MSGSRGSDPAVGPPAGVAPPHRAPGTVSWTRPVGCRAPRRATTAAPQCLRGLLKTPELAPRL
eukprot:2515037-Pyramimonas_sp.AAC.1